MADQPLFSLVLATAATREMELVRLLQSIAGQEYDAVEVLIVDQNDDERVQPIVCEFRTRLRIVHERSPRGLSRARNVGLDAASGDVIAFPDDDCWYPPGLLQRVAAGLAERPHCAALCGRVVDAGGAATAGKFDRTPGPITRGNVWNRAASVSLFVRRTAVRRVGYFDEALGAGAATRWQSGEETDYLLRMLAAGLAAHYDPRLEVGHPATVFGGAAARRKAYRYGMGMGKVLQKHDYPFSFVFESWIRTAGGTARALLRGNVPGARFGLAMLGGRMSGYVGARCTGKRA